MAWIAPQASGLGLGIEVRESLAGQATWFTLSNGPVQRFQARWENIGTVPCLVRPRIEFFTEENGTAGPRAYTSWGSEEPVMPGSGHEWKLFSALPGGDYLAVMKVIHCGEVMEEDPYRFSVEEWEPLEGLGIRDLTVFPDHAEARVSGDARVVVPEEYPGGWVFLAGEAENGVARLDFVNVGDEGSVTLRAGGADGVGMSRKFSVSVPEEAGQDRGVPLWAVAVILAAVILIIYVIGNIIKIWRR